MESANIYVQPSRTADWVVHEIKRLILDRGLQSGDPVPSEVDLASMLGISRSSVREAIKVLSTLDIVQVQHGKGTFVSNMSLEPMVQSLIFRGALTPNGGLMALRDAVEIRAQLDSAYAHAVTTALHDHPDEKLRDIVYQMEVMAKKGKPFLELDREYHKEISRKAKNLLLSQLIDAFWDIEEAMHSKLRKLSTDELIKLAQQHRDIIEAAEAGDIASYRALMSAHYAPLLDTLPRTPELDMATA
ncbi:MAG: GntR family transcriptional regulator [Arcanobacterium sp.]|nr:GntR family transcriptional regulator [Arcanobacterium sp.]